MITCEACLLATVAAGLYVAHVIFAVVNCVALYNLNKWKGSLSTDNLPWVVTVIVVTSYQCIQWLFLLFSRYADPGRDRRPQAVPSRCLRILIFFGLWLEVVPKVIFFILWDDFQSLGELAVFCRRQGDSNVSCTSIDGKFYVTWTLLDMCVVLILFSLLFNYWSNNLRYRWLPQSSILDLTSKVLARGDPVGLERYNLDNRAPFLRRNHTNSYRASSNPQNVSSSSVECVPAW